MNAVDAWPSLPVSEWAETKDTLHLWMQIVGKVRLLLAPKVNHWWHVPLYVTARGLTTSAMPYGPLTVELSFDFIDHVLRVDTSHGAVEEVALRPRSVADFYRVTMAARDAPQRAIGEEGHQSQAGNRDRPVGGPPSRWQGSQGAKASTGEEEIAEK